MDPRDRKPTFDILKVDFEWVKKTKSVKELRQALAALKEEGGYSELEKEIEAKLETIAPSSKLPSNSLSSTEKQQLDQELLAWQAQIERQDKGLAAGESPEDVEKRVRADSERQKGNEHMKAKDYELAVEAYTAAHQLQPGNAIVLSNRAQAHLNLKNFQKALEDSDAAIQLDAQFVKAYHRKGKALAAMQRFAEALPCFKKVLELDPSNAEAASETQKCRQHVPDSNFKSVKIEEDSDESGSEGGSPDSISDSESGVAEGLSRADAIKTEGNALFQHGNFGEAIHRYEAALTELKSITSKRADGVNEAKAALYNNLAACYSQTEELHKVIECSTMAVNLVQPSTVLKAKALLRRALAYEKLEKIDSAKRDMELVKSLDPGNLQASQALQRYSKILLEACQRSAALKEMDVQQLLTQVDRIKENGNKCFATEDFDNAILEFTAGVQTLQEKMAGDEELRLNPQVITRLVAMLGNRAAANLKLECNTQVIQDCKSVLALDKNNLKALYRLSKGHENCGQLEDAAHCLTRFLEIDPRNSGIKKELEALLKKIESLKNVTLTESHGREKRRKVSFRADIAEQIPPQTVEEATKEGEPQPGKTGKITEIAEKAGDSKPVEARKPAVKATISASVVAEAKTLATSLVTDTEAPPSATVFQTRIQSLKPDLVAVSRYIQRLDPIHVCGLFSQSQMDIDLMLGLFKALRQGPQPDAAWLWTFLEGISGSFRFDLTAKMLSKGDKRDIGELIEQAMEGEEEKQRLRGKFRMD